MAAARLVSGESLPGFREPVRQVCEGRQERAAKGLGKCRPEGRASGRVCRQGEWQALAEDELKRFWQRIHG